MYPKLRAFRAFIFQERERFKSVQQNYIAVINMLSTYEKEIVNNLIPTIKETTNYDSIEDVRKSIKDNISLYTKIVDKTIKESNLNKTFHINYGKNFFPEKEYKNQKYKSGNYESLVIELGKASGENFWCVLFPPLCFTDKEDNIEYKSIIKEIIDKYF